MKFIHSLRLRVLGGSFLLLLALFGFFSYFAIRFQNDQVMSNVLQSANRMSDVIKNSTHYSMLLNRKEDVYQIITMIGKEPGVEGIRIYNKRGEIMFSTDKIEEQTVVDMHAEACFVCHEQQKPLQSLPTANRMRIYSAPAGHRILGLINPIRNEPACSNADCHAHPPDRTVLGVLDVRMSLERFDKEMSAAQLKMILFAVATVALLALASFFYLHATVIRPVRRLMVGTEEISSGNLQYQLRTGSQDEIGQLARSFNAMTASLRELVEEKQRWSSELEKRVEEKTAELKHIHEQIFQIEKMTSLGKLAATVAHELNNPLEGILTYAKLLAKRLRKPDVTGETAKSMVEELDLIVHETERCGNIVKNLLLFSRKQVGEFALVPIREVVQRAAQLVRHHFEISGVKFADHYAPEEVALMCDENQIQQALVALFVNAVEAMPGGGSLSIDAAQPARDGPIRITLTDTGVGIAEGDLEHIFEPFFTTKKEGRGVGLGLSVVYGIVERHGGHIDVASALGRGTCFTITFPPAHAVTVPLTPDYSQPVHPHEG